MTEASFRWTFHYQQLAANVIVSRWRVCLLMTCVFVDDVCVCWWRACWMIKTKSLSIVLPRSGSCSGSSRSPSCGWPVTRVSSLVGGLCPFSRKGEKNMLFRFSKRRGQLLELISLFLLASYLTQRWPWRSHSFYSCFHRNARISSVAEQKMVSLFLLFSVFIALFWNSH